MALGVYIMVSLVAHFFCLLFPVRKTPLWCLDNNLCNKEIFPSQILHGCKEEQLSVWSETSPFGGQWEHTHFNTRNKDTNPTGVRGAAPALQSTCHTSPLPFLAGSVPWGDEQGAAPQVIPLAHPRAATLSHQHTSPWSRWSSAPSWALNRTHTTGSSLLWAGGIWRIPMAQHHGTCIASGPHEPEAVLQIFGVSGQIYSHAWQSGSGAEVTAQWSDQECDILWLVSGILWHTYPLWVDEQNVFSSVSHSLPFQFRIQPGNRKNPHLRPG